MDQRRRYNEIKGDKTHYKCNYDQMHRSHNDSLSPWLGYTDNGFGFFIPGGKNLRLTPAKMIVPAGI
jgi:hypothetical protein